MTLRETYMDLNRKKKNQDLLCKLGAWESWEKVEGERGGREESREKHIAL